MLILEQDTIRKKRVKNNALSEFKKKLEARNNKKFKVESIINSAV